MKPDYEEIRRTVEEAKAKGLISSQLITEKKREARSEKLPIKRMKRSPKFTRDKKECPACRRAVLTLNGKITSHRASEDKRGYGNGAWCSYSEQPKFDGLTRTD